MLEEPARLADDVTKLVLDRLKMRVDPLAAGSLQGTEQLIAPRIISLSFGHGDTLRIAGNLKVVRAAKIAAGGPPGWRLARDPAY